MVALVLLLGYAAAASSAPSVLAHDIYLTDNQGFCSPGAYPATIPAPGHPPQLKQWGSFCPPGDNATGVAESSPFTATRSVGLYLAGYLPRPGLSLEIENLAKRSRLPIVPDSEAKEQWVRYDVRLPASWRGDPVRLVARDTAARVEGWFAFSEPVVGESFAVGSREAIQLLLRTLLYFFLAILPCLFAGTVAIRRGLRDVVFVGLLELAAIGAWGYLAFWLWFIAPKLGHLFSFLLPIVAGIWFAWNYRRLDVFGRHIMKRLLVPLALTGAASLLIVSTGFVYGGFEKPFQTAATRYSHPLPPDNTIPYRFAEGLRNGHVPKPLQADWLSSDRPPLQTGLVLSQYAYLTKPRELGYTVQGVILQSLWIFAAWLLLTAFDVDLRAVALVLAVCLFSGFVFLNSFFVWPKLLAAAYLLGLFAILFTPKCAVLPKNSFVCILAGALLALAMLGHGGSAFAIIGAALTMLILRRRMPIKSFALIVVSATVIYMPWILYQKFYDPPGNRLLKMHLAGVLNVDARSLSETLISAYSALTPRQYLWIKVINAATLFETSERLWIETADVIRYLGDPAIPAQIAGVVRGWMFFYFVTNLGFLVIGPITLLIGIGRRYRTHEWRAAGTMWIYIVVTAAAWCLLIFTPRNTIIATATYSIVLLGYAGSILAVWAASRLLALAVGCLQITLNVSLYVVFMHPGAPQALLAARPPLLGCLILCALSLICVFWLLAKSSRTIVNAGKGNAPGIRGCPRLR